MRVLQVIDSLVSGGKERQCVELLKGLTREPDITSGIVVMSDDIFFQELYALPNLEIRRLVRRWRYDPTIFYKLYAFCRAFKPDVIAVWESMTAMYALPSAKLLGAKYVTAMIQDAPRRVSRKVAIRAALSFPLSDAIVANSRAGLKAYGVTSPRAVVIHSAYDTSRLKHDPGIDVTRKKFDITARYVVGMVAAFRPDKDHPTFIAAARRILGLRQDVVFVLVGGGETLERCQRLLHEEERRHIRFLGRLTDPIESIVSMFDVGVLSSFTEGISNSIIEYMALGKPVVATDGGGTDELVLDGQTGYLVPPGDAEATAERVLSLLDDHDLRISMGEAGRRRVLEEFALEKMIASHISLYRRLLSR